MTLVLGLDPGPTNVGWAVIDFTISTAPVWYGGAADSTQSPVALLEYLLASYPTVRVVGIEQPRAVNNPAANVQAMATAWAGGELAGIARHMGLDVRPLGVTQWRRALVGSFEKGANIDHVVERWLRTFVRQMPKRTSVHARDAAGVACVAFRGAPPDLKGPCQSVVNKKLRMSTHHHTRTPSEQSGDFCRLRVLGVGPGDSSPEELRP
jgi:Holliday junction resolvasome RuvABC endonuclease subunit